MQITTDFKAATSVSPFPTVSFRLPSPRAAFKLLLSGVLLLSSAANATLTTTIQTPPPNALASLSNAASLQALTLANLVATNCDVAALSDGDAALLAGTAQAVAENMGLSHDEYFAHYLPVVLAQFNTPDACAQHADSARALLQQIKTLGGRVLVP